MNFIGYLILGGVVYTIGFMINLKILTPKRQTGIKYTLTHPTILQLLAGCFVAMLVVSALIGRFIIGHDGIDLAFVVVNSLVATFIFYFGVNPDQTQMNLPN